MKLKKVFLFLISTLTIAGFSNITNQNKVISLQAAPPDEATSVVSFDLKYKGQSTGTVMYGQTGTYYDMVGSTVSLADFTGTVKTNDGKTQNYTPPTWITFSRDITGTSYSYNDFEVHLGKNSFYFVHSAYLGQITFQYKFDVIGEKASTAEDVATDFNNNIDLYCNEGINPTLTGENSVSSTWATAAEQYSSLNDEEKAKFNASSGSSSSEITEMLSKYDYIYGKYGSTIGEDFLNRFDYDPATQGNRYKLNIIKDVNDSTLIITVVSIIGLTSVGVYFFYRKRKENY